MGKNTEDGRQKTAGRFCLLSPVSWVLYWAFQTLTVASRSGVSEISMRRESRSGVSLISILRNSPVVAPLRTRCLARLARAVVRLDAAAAPAAAPRVQLVIRFKGRKEN